jgi:hypothetical protein
MVFIYAWWVVAVPGFLAFCALAAIRAWWTGRYRHCPFCAEELYTTRDAEDYDNIANGVCPRCKKTVPGMRRNRGFR